MIAKNREKEKTVLWKIIHIEGLFTQYRQRLINYLNLLDEIGYVCYNKPTIDLHHGDHKDFYGGQFHENWSCKVV